MGRDPEGWSKNVFRTRFLSFFGVDPAVVVEVWDLIRVPFIDDGDLSHAQPKHLMWALLFLRKYGDESEMARLAGGFGGAVDEKTFRKWSKIFVHQITSLKYNVVSSFVIGSSCSFRVTDCCFWSLFVADHLGEPKGRGRRKRLFDFSGWNRCPDSISNKWVLSRSMVHKEIQCKWSPV